MRAPMIKGRQRYAVTILAAVLITAAVNLGWGLGRSSLFVDEVYSWRAASLPLHPLMDRVRSDEVAPPTYYVGLHEWIGRTGSQTEAWLRFPSLVSALMLIAALAWLGWRLGGAGTGILAAAFAALSPLILEYGQQVRAYLPATLFAAVAVGSVLEAEAREGRARLLWMTGAAVAAVTAFWLHYTAALVTGPLLLWTVLRSRLPRRVALGFAASVIVVSAVWLPLMAHQLSLGHESGIRPGAGLTWSNLALSIAAPFDGRLDRATWWIVLGLGLLGVSYFLVATRAQLRDRTLLLSLAALAPVALVVLTLADTHVLISRYAVVAAPYMLIVIAVAAMSLPGVAASP